MPKLLKIRLAGVLIVILLSAILVSPAKAQDGSSVSASDLISLVNGIRTGNGLPALEVHSILMSTAQSTAEIMAANMMGWHIGDVRGRVMAAGYGGGATAWATENFAVGNFSLEDLAWIWSDAAHMIPMVNPAYQHIGAGIATAPDGSIYYVVQAAYASGSPIVRTQSPGGNDALDPTAPPAQWVIPVEVATPDTSGAVVHEVKMGQSLWSIAIAYNTHIVDILRFNNMSPEQQVVWIGQKLNMPVTPQAPSPTSEVTVGSTSNLEAISANLTHTPRSVLATSTPGIITPTTLVTTPTPAQSGNSENQGKNLTVPIILGGIFIVGLILIILGIFMKRPVV